MNFSIATNNDVMTKLAILSDAAKYDVSCASSGSERENEGGVGAAHKCGICHSWTDDGRCVSLLKILLTNNCIYDCAYCINRRSNDRRRATLTADEVINLTIEFYRRNYIEGLFLSSGVIRTPDYTMEQFIKIAKTLRERERYYGYIHMKAIPGADSRLIAELGKYVDRLSVNIELPSEKSLTHLAPEKTKESIVAPMKQIGTGIQEYKNDIVKYKHTEKFVPAGQSTQLIIGATPETDYHIINLSENLYKKMELKRVYYSAYLHVNPDNRLPAINQPPLLREHRLYQADWLLRFYKFKAEEILTPENPNLDTNFDPKINWALNNFHHFPVEINKADFEMILRVPGIGPQSAKKIVQARRYKLLTFDILKKMRIVLKRARFFITCNGKFLDYDENVSEIRERLLAENIQNNIANQLTLF